MIPKETIREWTKTAGLTVERAAEVCGVPVRTMEYWRRHRCVDDAKAEPLRLAAGKAGGGR
jgi:hypothetical protein